VAAAQIVHETARQLFAQANQAPALAKFELAALVRFLNLLAGR
jgi:hypothetical protein